MCGICGCDTRPRSQHAEPSGDRRVAVLDALLAENDRIAAHVRGHLDDHRTLAVNLMSSPGAGKTSLLEATIDLLPPDVRVAVIEGDLETENDAERIRSHGVAAVQITTGIACHLDAAMVHDALHDLPLHDIDILFVENVGNLVCPADFDVGQHRNVVLIAVTEGDDKPAKYPLIFRSADLVLISKTDLLPYLDDFDIARARRAVARVHGGVQIEDVSAKTSRGLEKWIEWLMSELAAYRSTLAGSTAGSAEYGSAGRIDAVGQCGGQQSAGREVELPAHGTPPAQVRSCRAISTPAEVSREG